MKIWHYHDFLVRHFLVYLNQKSLSSEIRMLRSFTQVHVFPLTPQLGGALTVSSHPWKKTVWPVLGSFFGSACPLLDSHWFFMWEAWGEEVRGDMEREQVRSINKAFLSLAPFYSQFDQISITLCWGLFGPLNIPLGHSIPISAVLKTLPQQIIGIQAISGPATLLNLGAASQAVYLYIEQEKYDRSPL